MIKYPKCLFDKYGIDKVIEKLTKAHYSKDLFIVHDQLGNQVIYSINTKEIVNL